MYLSLVRVNYVRLIIACPTKNKKEKNPGNYFFSCERTMKNIKHLQEVYSLNKYECSLWNQYPQRRVFYSLY